MPEIVQEIGAYAGLASVLGLAVLSALYFSQARDVRRLREWAGRAPERASEPAEAVQPVPGRVVAQPQPRPAGAPPAVPGSPQPARATPPEGAPKPVPTAQPVGAMAGKAAVPAAAAAAAKAGAGPAVASQTDSADSEPDEETDGSASQDTDTAAPAPPKPGDPPTPAPQAVPANSGPAASAAAPAAPAAPAATPAAKPGAAPAVPGGGAPPRPASPATPAGGRPSGAPLVPGAGAAPAATPAAASPAARSAATRSAPQNTQVISPPRESLPRRLFGSTRNTLLAIAGVLVLGIGVAVALTQLSSDDPSAPSEPAQQQPAGGGEADNGESQEGNQAQRRAIDPATVTVAVLNGTTVPGLAQSLSNEVTRFGFDVGTVANSQDDEGQQRAESVILYANGNEREAALVSRKLGISQREPVDPATQGLAGDATVVVIAGADRQ